MDLIDSHGLRTSHATPESLDALDTAAHELLCLVGDPLAGAERAIALNPEMPMAHLLKAWIFLLSTEAPALPAAREALATAAGVPLNDREQRHLDAAQALADGRWREAAQRLEDLSLRYPLDTLALQVGHQLDFFQGDSRMLRDRIARAMPAWDPAVPGWHAVLGMHAFGLEECGDYVQAEAQGRRSVALQPRDSWAWHAVAHVHEMRHDPRAGIAWLQTTSDTWSDGSFLATHNWWHLALFHLELDQADEVLRLYDRSIGGPGSAVALDMVDASAMLWRLQLRGVDVGTRWQPLAERWKPHAQSANYAFNDLHAMLAFLGAGDRAAQQAVLDAQAAAMARAGDDNAMFTRDVGDPATRAVIAFAVGDFATSARLLRGIRHHAHRFGGSHAQRDLIDLTLIEAALRAQDPALARGLAAERLAARPHSAMAQRFARRAQAVRPEA